MEITETKIKGCFVIKRDFFRDERGYFSRAFCRSTFEKYGLKADFVQSNISGNIKKNTLRGMHSLQIECGENKLVICTRGKITDVCVDVRRDSKTYKQYVSEELTEDNGKCLYIPAGCAHGFLTLADDTQVLYYHSCDYDVNKEKCYRFDDPAFGIDWGIEYDKMTISEKDNNHKFLEEI